MNQQTEFVNMKQAAALLGVTQPTLRRRLRAAADLTLYQGKDGRERLVKRTDLARWLGVRPISRPNAN